ncbi:MAG: 5-formyltetrahydrofolate cyclo-ligase [Gammaproteobacteria bacterium]|nr:5-formyltetrahydrofolate cyclo-ligase [Gammaproteobacteria bacterium]
MKHNSQAQEQRRQLRQQLRENRRQLSDKRQHLHARQLAKNLRLSRHFMQASDIAFYLAEDGEISAEYAIKLAWTHKKRVYLPLISPYGNELFFALYTPATRMKLNRFGIAEPAAQIKHCKRAHQLQLIFMPLTGFDLRGNRLGMGGGFYDRSLHFRRHQKSWRKPKLLGLAHECQKLDQMPVEDWDIPVDGVITEKKLYRF